MNSFVEQRSNHYPFHYWHAGAREIGETATEFLHALTGPAHVYIPGRDQSRCRAAITLLHGNEPSGFFATFQLLRKQVQPAVDLHCLIANVRAAQADPVFFHRTLPGETDLNRCFKPPFTSAPESRLAKGILDTLMQFQPEAVLDIHNTSGSGPAFGVTTFMDPRHEALVSLFTPRIMVTDLKLGALMEISETHFPTVTVECGGAQDPESPRLAEEGLTGFACRENVLTPPPADFAMDFFYNPIRLELRDKASLTYGDKPSARHDLTLLPQIETYNFGIVDPGTELGFSRRALREVLIAPDSRGHDRLDRYFSLIGGRLVTRRALKLFMVTTNAEIARDDCLLYLVPAERHRDAIQFSG
ncbi:succinylglutamate desuccinylase [Gilvimarinus sp. F26214L]|uniref:succinylglutamate desuccinylase n=1 Tax=Gilvimarinus sp. DZF01 TaxID=3461371 RepID=UPI0040463D82